MIISNHFFDQYIQLLVGLTILARFENPLPVFSGWQSCEKFETESYRGKIPQEVTREKCFYYS